MFAQYKLPNGIKVILSPSRSTAAVTFLVVVKVGSRNEATARNGISHFLEHLMFKGTKRRPNTLVLSQELDAIGADYNAYTSKDHTAYYIKAEATHLDLAVDMLADMLTQSLFDPVEIERERGTILEEINMYEDNPMARIGDMFEGDLFGDATSLGRRVIGTPESLAKIKQPQIIDYWRTHYRGANITLSLAGSFQNKPALNLLKKKFGAISRGRREVIKHDMVRVVKPKLAAHFKATNQAHLVMGFPAWPYNHPDRYIASLLSIILGGNMSSRLFIQVRERLGLCYFIRSGVDAYEDSGSFAIQAGLDLTKLDKALAAVSRELKDIKTRGVKSDELNKAQQFFQGKLVLGLEDSFDVAAFYAKQVVFDRAVVTPAQLLAKIQKVTVADIKRVARVLLDPKKVRITTISPLKDIKHFAKHLDF